MASDRLKEIRDQVRQLRTGVPLELTEGLTVLICYPPLGVASKWDADTGALEMLKHCVATEDGTELLYIDATQDDVDNIPIDVIRQMTDAIGELLVKANQELVMGNSASATTDAEPSTSLPSSME